MTDKPTVDVVETTLDEPVKRVDLSQADFRAVAMTIAAALILVIAFSAYLYERLDKLVDDNRVALDELRQIQTPTAKEFEQQFEAGLTRCAHSPRCRQLFPELAKAGRRVIHHEKATQHRRKQRQQNRQSGNIGNGTHTGQLFQRGKSPGGSNPTTRPQRRRPGHSGPPSSSTAPSHPTPAPPTSAPPLLSTPPIHTPPAGPVPPQDVPPVTVPCPKVDDLTC